MLREYVSYFKITENAKKDIRHLKKMVFYNDDIDTNIKEAWNKYNTELGNSLLKNMPIDRLSDVESGMPIEILKEYGFKVVYDCIGLNQQYFSRFPGIGEVKSRRIVVAVYAIKKAVFEELDTRIIDNESSEHLLECIYRKIEFKEKEADINSFEKDKNKLIKEIQYSISLVNKMKLILPWFFYKDKESIFNAMEELSGQDISGFSEMYEELYNIKMPESLKDNFKKNSIEYYSTLEKTLNLKVDNDKTYLSNQLIEKIENTYLNTNELIVSPRGYQYFGAKYMISQERTLIGDEMGLGKTIEALVAINHLYQEKDGKYFIVIAPLSVMTNWKRETEKWTKLKTYVFHGNNRRDTFSLWLEFGGVLITTYGHAGHIKLNKIKKIDMLVVDEAHYIKNPKAIRSKVVYALGENSSYLTYMSGTPLENNVGEMIQLISKLQYPIASQLKNNLTNYSIRPKTFRKKIAPVYLRRNRKDVLSELPDLEEVEYWLPFGKREINHYKEAIEEGNFMKMRRSGWSGGTTADSPKLNALLDICEQAKAEGHKILIFSFFRKVLDLIDNELSDRSVGQITGDINSIKRQEIIDNFEKSDDGSVLISQIMAGGVGLNIQSANIIIICEPQYKPSTEEQAISRSYRMGQTKDVIVYRLLTEDSVDERILTLLHGKKEIFSNFAKDSTVAEQSSMAVDASDKVTTRQIIELEAERYGLKLKK